MKDLTQVRAELDAVDRDMVALLEKRMGLALDVAAYKSAHGLNVLDAGREAAVLDSRCAYLHDARWEPDVRAVYETIMARSRGAQAAWIKEADKHD